jgi:hypothetical protein
MTKSKTTILLIFSLMALVLTGGQFAVAGGSDGGGKPIETLFKVKGLAIARYLNEMSSDAKKYLKFNPKALLDYIEKPGNFVPRCATKSDYPDMEKQKFTPADIELDQSYLHKLEDLNKAAMVNSEHRQVVHLLCEAGNDADWRNIFNADDDVSTIFMIHELLRVYMKNSHPEDDYSLSASYIDAAKKETEIRLPFLQKVLFAKEGETACSVKTKVKSVSALAQAGYRTTTYLIDFIFLVNGNPVWDSEVNDYYTIQNYKHTDIDSSRSVVLNDSKASRKIVELLKVYHCPL